MNLSISNFKTEAKVVSLVLLALVLCELGLRKFETSLSFDLRHIRAIPRIANDLAGANGLRILFLGNSFTRVSVDPDIFLAEMKSRGFNNVAIERVFPDGTRLTEWYYAFKRYFVEPDLAPDLLVIITGRAHLPDQPTSSSALGAYYFSKTDVINFLASPTNSVDDKVELLLTRYCAVFANRHRIEPRVFTRIIPHYQTCIQRINEQRFRNTFTPQWHEEPEYSRLEELLKLGEEQSIPIVIATVPLLVPYSIDPKVPALIAKHKMTFVEASELEELDSSHFPDGYHIDRLGTEIYTRKIAEEISKLLEANPGFGKAR